MLLEAGLRQRLVPRSPSKGRQGALLEGVWAFLEDSKAFRIILTVHQFSSSICNKGENKDNDKHVAYNKLITKT